METAYNSNVEVLEEEGGIYVHIPYCSHRCGYCAFFSGGVRKADWDGYATAVANELKERQTEIPRRLKTLYFGGGTPSLMPAGSFGELMKGIKKGIEEAGCEEVFEEVTVEANPDDVTEELADVWEMYGVTRVSLGVQSFSEKELRILDRRHNPEHVSRALDVLCKRFGNVSVDLIFGIPGQGLQDWERHLESALASGVKHLSCYSLSYEERTLLTYRLKQGEVRELGDVDTERMYEELLEATRRHGFEHYELSNFALPGFESRHNNLYWTGKPYLGLGPSASSYDGKGMRRTNGATLKDWTKGAETEHLSTEERQTEYIMTRLRLASGLDIMEYGNLFGTEASEELERKAGPFINGKELEWVDNGSGRRLAVGDSGWMKHDYIISSLI